MNATMVDASSVRFHVGRLRRAGVGIHRIAEVSGVAHTSIENMLNGRPVKASTRDRLLAVKTSDAADGALVDSTETWSLVDRMLRTMPIDQLARRLDVGNPSNLRRRRRRCTGGFARRVRELDAELVLERRAGRSRLPVQPILDELTRRGATTVTAQAEWLGVDCTQVYRWQDKGVPLFTADRLAVLLQRHPLMFWPDDFHLEAVA